MILNCLSPPGVGSSLQVDSTKRQGIRNASLSGLEPTPLGESCDPKQTALICVFFLYNLPAQRTFDYLGLFRIFCQTCCAVEMFRITG